MADSGANGPAILVTGASGLIGSALRSRLLDRYPSLYCQSRQHRESVPQETWIRFDLTDSFEKLDGYPEFDLVFHLAAQTSAQQARNDPIEALKDNVTGFLCLLERLKHQDKKPLVIMAGTVTQVGVPEEQTITEILQDDPVTFYDLTKLTAERFLLRYVNEGWIDGCCLRLATVFGNTHAKQANDRGIIDKVVRSAIAGKPIHVYGTGEYIRDYIHIEDVVDAFLAAADFRDRVSGRYYVIGTGTGTTVRDAFQQAADIAHAITARQVTVATIDPPEPLSVIDQRNAVVDSSAFRNVTGWAPKFDLAEGLRRSYLPQDDR